MKVILTLLAFVATGCLCFAENLSSANLAEEPERLISMNFRDCPLKYVMEFYSDLSGKDVTIDLWVDETFTINSETRVTKDEALDIVTRALGQKGISLIDIDTKTIRVTGPKKRISSQSPKSSYMERRQRRMELIRKADQESGEEQTGHQGEN